MIEWLRRQRRGHSIQRQHQFREVPVSGEGRQPSTSALSFCIFVNAINTISDNINCTSSSNQLTPASQQSGILGLYDKYNPEFSQTHANAHWRTRDIGYVNCLYHIVVPHVQNALYFSEKCAHLKFGRSRPIVIERGYKLTKYGLGRSPWRQQYSCDILSPANASNVSCMYNGMEGSWSCPC